MGVTCEIPKVIKNQNTGTSESVRTVKVVEDTHKEHETFSGHVNMKFNGDDEVRSGIIQNYANLKGGDSKTMEV